MRYNRKRGAKRRSSYDPVGKEGEGVLVGRSAAQAPSEAGCRTRRSRVGEDERPKRMPSPD
jgi:hypothetical protein